MFLKILIFNQMEKKYSDFMETEVSLLCIQKSVTEP
jgi:hypothetical protein